MELFGKSTLMASFQYPHQHLKWGQGVSYLDVKYLDEVLCMKMLIQKENHVRYCYGSQNQLCYTLCFTFTHNDTSG